VHYSPTFDEAVEYLLKNVQPPAAILIMSAGDAPLIGLNYLKLRQGKTDGEAAGQTG
jgi:UDP-N-acetylmuramate-alanine ligase